MLFRKPELLSSRPSFGLGSNLIRGKGSIAIAMIDPKDVFIGIPNEDSFVDTRSRGSSAA
jgi:hypothetical protein